MSYNDKLDEEIRNFENMTKVHDLPAIFHYWSQKFLGPKFEDLGYTDPYDFFVQYIAQAAQGRPDTACRVLSLGAGNCDAEILVANSLIERGVLNFNFDCLDLNPQMLRRGEASANERGLAPHFGFIETDINSWDANIRYDVIMANQSLHHIVELEQLIDKSYRALEDNGLFLASDMIGRNGHMRWPEALELVQACWSLLDDKHKWNRQLSRFEPEYENWDCSTSGFEGIRSQDILPLLVKTFHFESFLGFANLINIFVDRAFGHNFDVANPRDCYFIDFVSGLDDYFIETGRIKPTQMLAAMTKTSQGPPRFYKHLTPEFCIREVPAESGHHVPPAAAAS